MSMAQNGYKSICFISSVSGEFEHVNEIVDKLSQVVDTCVLEKSILSSAKSLQSVQKYDCVILVEKLDQSYYEDIIREFSFAPFNTIMFQLEQHGYERTTDLINKVMQFKEPTF